MARKGALKTGLHMNVALDQQLAATVKTSAEIHERTLTQEVRYVLRQFYQRETPAEAQADGSL